MKFKLLLLAEESDGPAAEVLFQTNEPATIAKLRGFLSNVEGQARHIVTGRAGAPGRSVRVLGKQEDCTVPLEQGDTFSNAYEASVALGYTYNAVSQALRIAKLKGDTSTIVRGVELQYVDETPGRV